MLVATSPTVPEREVSETIGIVDGATTRARNIILDTWAGIKSLFGGRIKPYTKLMEDARQEAIEKMEERAREMGADAVVGVRVDTSTGAEATINAHAYGTAVKFK